MFKGNIALFLSFNKRLIQLNDIKKILFIFLCINLYNLGCVVK